MHENYINISQIRFLKKVFIHLKKKTLQTWTESVKNILFAKPSWSQSARPCLKKNCFGFTFKTLEFFEFLQPGIDCTKVRKWLGWSRIYIMWINLLPSFVILWIRKDIYTCQRIVMFISPPYDIFWTATNK